MPPKCRASEGIAAAVRKVKRPAATITSADVQLSSARAQVAATSSMTQPAAATIDSALVEAVTKSILTALAAAQSTTTQQTDPATQQVNEVLGTAVLSITGNNTCNTQSQFVSASISITGESVQLDELLQEQGEKNTMLPFDPEAMMGISLVPKLNKKGLC